MRSRLCVTGLFFRKMSNSNTFFQFYAIMKVVWAWLPFLSMAKWHRFYCSFHSCVGKHVFWPCYFQRFVFCSLLSAYPLKKEKKDYWGGKRYLCSDKVEELLYIMNILFKPCRAIGSTDGVFFISRIKGWWLTHHFISTVCAGISLIWWATVKRFCAYVRCFFILTFFSSFL